MFQYENCGVDFSLFLLPRLHFSTLEIAIPILWIVLGLALIVIAYIGCVVPGLPGPPFAFGSLIVLQLTKLYVYPTWLLVSFGILAVCILVLDYLVPVIGTKTFGGSRNGMIGSVIGLLVGLFLFPPFGIIIGPFAGAVCGELIGGKEFKAALKAGLGALLGFLVGTFSKLLVTSIIAIVFFYGAIKFLINLI